MFVFFCSALVATFAAAVLLGLKPFVRRGRHDAAAGAMAALLNNVFAVFQE